MRWRMTVLFIPLLLLVTLVPSSAVGVEDVMERQKGSLEIDELEQAAREAGGIAEYGATLDAGLTDLLDVGGKEVGGIVKEALRSGVSLMVIVLFCGLGETICETSGKRVGAVIPLVGTLAISVVSIKDVNSMLGMGQAVIGKIAEFANVLLPVTATVTAATGAVTGAAVRQMAAVLFSDLLVNLINRLLIPVLNGYLMISIAYAAIGNDGLKRMGALLKWLITTVLTTVMLSFVGYLTISGVVAGSADAASIKAAKFAISGTIPVVGGILSDAAETILVSAGVLRGTVGVFGAVTILGICLLPLLRIGVHYLIYKLIAAVSATVGPGRVCTLMEQFGGAFGLILVMAGACGLLMLVALVSSIMAVSV